MGLTTKQALKLLMDGDQNYIHHHSMGKSTLHDGCGDDLGQISGTVFNRLLRTDKVKYFAESALFWSNGYFKYQAGGKKLSFTASAAITQTRCYKQCD
jgi:hypothetical protein